LLRSFIKAVLTNGNEGGEIQARHEFRTQIVPLNGSPDVTGLTRRGQAHAARIRAIQLDPRDIAGVGPSTAVRPARDLPAFHSFLAVSTEPVVTAVLRHYPEKTPLVRLFNPTTNKINASVRLDGTTHGVLTDLEGRPGDPVKPGKDGQMQFAARPKQIVTVRLS
jgi:hypothetical protein